MGAGAYDRLVRLQRPVTTRDRLGSPSTAFVDATAYAHPAARLYISGLERQRAAEVGAVEVDKFGIRWDPAIADLDPSWRLLCEGRTFNIAERNEIGRRKGWSITGHARAETPDPGA